MKLTREYLHSLVKEQIQEYYDKPKIQQKIEIQNIADDQVWFYDHRRPDQVTTMLPVEMIRVNIVNPSAAAKMNLPGMVDGIVGLTFPNNLMAQPHDTVFFHDKKEMTKLATLLDKATTVAFQTNKSESHTPMKKSIEGLWGPTQIETLGGIRTYQESSSGGRQGAAPVFLDMKKPTRVKVGAVRVFDPASKRPVGLVIVSVSTQVSYHTAKSFHSPIGGGYDVGWGKEHDDETKDSSFAFLAPAGAKKLATLLRSHTKDIGLHQNKILPAIPLDDDGNPLPVDDEGHPILPALPVE